jgi:hypothetical protein
MKTRTLLALAIALSSATSAASQGKHNPQLASTMINGRRIGAHVDVGAASIATQNTVAVVSIPGHKIKIEKARITLDNQAKPIPAAARRVEIEARRGQVLITVDHKVLFPPGR